MECGFLEIMLGPMFSGKSTELIRQIRLMKVINKKVLVLKPKIDNRYVQDKITSHNWETVDCVVVEKLSEITDDKLIDISMIIIDEGQFFSDLKVMVLHWVEELKKHIIIGGLDGDYKRKPMGQILDLIPYSDKCIKFQSVCNICKDGTPAIFTHRTVSTKKTVLVGGSESYISLCRKHYLEQNNKI